MAADGRIVIDARANTGGAEKDLIALRNRAKSTAQEIAATGKTLDALRGNTRLKDNLDAARAAAEQTAKQLDTVNDRLKQVQAQAYAQARAELPNAKEKTLQDIARSRSLRQHGDLAAESDRLAARLQKQEAALEKASAAYQAQQAQVAALEQKHAGLTARLEEEEAAARAAENRFRLGVGLKGFGAGLADTARRGAAGLGGLVKSALSLGKNLKSGTKAADRFKSRLRGVVSGALIFNGISAALRSLTGYFGTALTKSAAFSGALADLKGAAATAAAPLLQILTPALTALARAAATAIGYVARLVSFFTGKSVSGMQAAASALSGVAAAGGKASKSLAGFDELNVLGDASGGGASASAPNFGFTPGESPFWQSVTDAIEGGDWAAAGRLFAEKINGLVEGFDARAMGQTLGRALQNGVSFAFYFMTGADWAAMGQTLAQLVNGLFSQVDGAQLGALLVSCITIGLLLLGNFLAGLNWAQTGKLLGDGFAGACLAIADAIQSVDWNAVGEGVKTALQNVDWEGVFQAVGLVLGSAAVALTEVVCGLFGDAWQWVIDTFTDAFDQTQEFCEETGYSWGDALIVSLFNGIAAVIGGVGAWIYEHVFEPFAEGIASAFDMHSPSKKAEGWGENVILGLLAGAANALAAGAGSLGEGLVGAFKGGINAVIDLINDFIGWVNGALSFQWDGLTLGGKTVFAAGSIQLARLPSIPYLAQGAVIPPNREFLAVLGDQKQGANIEAPADLIRQMVAEGVAEAMAQAGGSGEIHITFDGDLAQLGRVLHPVIEREGRRKGTTLIAKGALA